MEQAEFLAAQQQAEAQGAGYAVLTLAAVTGTTSRTQGKMLIFEDGRTLGTIGGGPGEYAAVQDALALIGSGETKLLQYRHGYGAITVLIETFAAPPLLVLCGGGNVGRCLLQYAKLAGFRRWLLDPRPAEQIAESVALADRFIPVTRYETALERLNTPPDAFYVAASFSHKTDLDAVREMCIRDRSFNMHLTPLAQFFTTNLGKHLERIFYITYGKRTASVNHPAQFIRSHLTIQKNAGMQTFLFRIIGLTGILIPIVKYSH